jgi:hypothetical protein
VTAGPFLLHRVRRLIVPFRIEEAIIGGKPQSGTAGASADRRDNQGASAEETS